MYNFYKDIDSPLNSSDIFQLKGGSMYKIGEFSLLNKVTIKTLRYYDKIGLLKPSYVDSYTNYRYYTEEELQRFKRIEYLKKLGFTLEEIKINLSNITLECLDQKRRELEIKRDLIILQISELDSFKDILAKNKVKIINKN